MCNPKGNNSFARNPIHLPNQTRNESKANMQRGDTTHAVRSERNSDRSSSRRYLERSRHGKVDSTLFADDGLSHDILSSPRRNKSRPRDRRSATPERKQASSSSNHSRVTVESDNSRSSTSSSGTEGTCASSSSSILSDSKPSSHTRDSKSDLFHNSDPRKLLRVKRSDPMQKPSRQASCSNLFSAKGSSRSHQTPTSRLHSSMPSFDTGMAIPEDHEADCASKQQDFLVFKLSQNHLKMIEQRRAKKLSSRDMMEISEKLDITIVYSSEQGFQLKPKNMSEVQNISDWLSGNS